MSALRCEQCAELQAEFRITSPAALQRVIATISGELAAGRLKECARAGRGDSLTTEFSSLQSGEFDDFVQCQFTCTRCAGGFSLTCETYHGSGGRWARVPSAG
jgi:hypothetical protein